MTLHGTEKFGFFHFHPRVSANSAILVFRPHLVVGATIWNLIKSNLRVTRFHQSSALHCSHRFGLVAFITSFALETDSDGSGISTWHAERYNWPKEIKINLPTGVKSSFLSEWIQEAKQPRPGKFHGLSVSTSRASLETASRVHLKSKIILSFLGNWGAMNGIFLK